MAILDHFQTKMFKSETTSFHYFSQGFRISNNIGHTTLGSRAKRHLSGNLKVNTQTDRHTDRRTDGRKNRLIESIDPKGRCFENKKEN